MTEISIYESRTPRDHIDRMYEVANLATIGAAATDTGLNLKSMNASNCTLFEMIIRLAEEAISMAEDEKNQAREEVKQFGVNSLSG